ncbi:DUF1376 domain-containing protein [Aquitalea magnusonii]|uniref:Uncharacterized protein DUF1376 n=1 Tax=Aquitalea magnusonii TaxID=332411 RepID=A0A318IV66_9NEIS|nr:DUF1376 domain-containing protein [Aquitalea magnusonii]PXX37837.1 uncharacterized protein DUF1376 [Aquitalea magnusonii]
MSATRKKSDRFAWFAMDAGAFLAETTGLSAAHVGVYIRLMNLYWALGGKLPEDMKLLRRRIGVTTDAEECALQEIMDEFFPSGRHEYLDSYRAEVEANSRMQSEKALRRHRKESLPSANQAKPPVDDFDTADF